MSRLLIAASGTGGHLFPALAVAQALPAHWQIHWLGVPDRLETELVPAGIPLHTVNAGGLQGKGLQKLLNLLRLLGALDRGRFAPQVFSLRSPGVAPSTGLSVSISRHDNGSRRTSFCFCRERTIEGGTLKK